jgi:hypothetical protein
MAQREQWEYFLYETSREGLLGPGTHLDSYGAEGWEAVGMTRGPEDGDFTILLKRRVIPPKSP